MTDFIKQYWLQFLFGLIATGLTVTVRSIYARLKKEIREQELIKEGVLALLHDRLYQACRNHIRNGYCPVEDLKNTEYLYRSYHNLGGNGTGTELFERVRRLPIEERGDAGRNE